MVRSQRDGGLSLGKALAGRVRKAPLNPPSSGIPACAADGRSRLGGGASTPGKPRAPAPPAVSGRFLAWAVGWFL